jgi:hypothetical protein
MIRFNLLLLVPLLFMAALSCKKKNHDTLPTQLTVQALNADGSAIESRTGWCKLFASNSDRLAGINALDSISSYNGTFQFTQVQAGTCYFEVYIQPINTLCGDMGNLTDAHSVEVIGQQTNFVNTFLGNDFYFFLQYPQQAGWSYLHSTHFTLGAHPRDTLMSFMPTRFVFYKTGSYSAENAEMYFQQFPRYKAAVYSIVDPCVLELSVLDDIHSTVDTSYYYALNSLDRHSLVLRTPSQNLDGTFFLHYYQPAQ